MKRLRIALVCLILELAGDCHVQGIHPPEPSKLGTRIRGTLWKANLGKSDQRETVVLCSDTFRSMHACWFARVHMPALPFAKDT